MHFFNNIHVHHSRLLGKIYSCPKQSHQIWFFKGNSSVNGSNFTFFAFSVQVSWHWMLLENMYVGFLDCFVVIGCFGRLHSVGMAWWRGAEATCISNWYFCIFYIFCVSYLQNCKRLGDCSVLGRTWGGGAQASGKEEKEEQWLGEEEEEKEEEEEEASQAELKPLPAGCSQRSALLLHPSPMVKVKLAICPTRLITAQTPDNKKYCTSSTLHLLHNGPFSINFFSLNQLL